MAEKYSLTVQQRNLMAFIEAYIAEHDGVAPSFAEMSGHLGLGSKSGVHSLITSLKERGHIKTIRGRSRSIMVVE